MSVTARAVEARPVSRTELSIVRAPEHAASNVPFFIMCVGILIFGLISALLLNTAMAASSYRMHDRQSELSVLAEQEAELTYQLQSLASPASLRTAASSLGMVPASGTVYISLAIGGITLDTREG